MRSVVLKSLSIANFKGAALLGYSFDERHETVRAHTGAGKSTLMYAWQWVLGLDVPDVIPKLENKELHNLETKVTAYVTVNGYEYRLTRTQTEEWKTNRSTGVEEKHTNVSGYNIDDVPYSAAKYKEKLGEIFGVPYEKLEMLTNKDYFNGDKPPKWTWSARRKELFEISHTEDILRSLAEKPEYALIAQDIHKGFSTADVRKAKMKALKGLNEQKDRNVTLLEDKQADLQRYETIDFAALEAVRADIERQMTLHEIEAAKASKDDAKTLLEEKLRRIITERAQQQLFVRNEQTRLKNLMDSLSNRMGRIKQEAEEKKRAMKDTDVMRAMYEAESREQWKGETVCPTCGQALPENKITAARDNFEADKERKLTLLGNEIKAAEIVNADVEKELTRLRRDYEELKMEREGYLAELDNFEPPSRLAELNREEAAVKKSLSEQASVAAAEIDEQRNDMRQRLREVTEKLAYKGIAETLKTRIAELKRENRELTDSETVCREAIRQLDAYVAEQVSMITDTINGLFGNGVGFCLFSEQYAGAESELKETCVCILDGKIYTSMSTGERFRANLEVVKALQTAYGVRLPIFCDNAECYTKGFEADSQIIELRAAEGKTLDCIRVQNLS